MAYRLHKMSYRGKNEVVSVNQLIIFIAGELHNKYECC